MDKEHKEKLKRDFLLFKEKLEKKIKVQNLNIEIKEDVENEEDETEYLTNQKKRIKRETNQLPKSLSKLSITSHQNCKSHKENDKPKCIGILEIKDPQNKKVPIHIQKQNRKVISMPKKERTPTPYLDIKLKNKLNQKRLSMTGDSKNYSNVNNHESAQTKVSRKLEYYFPQSTDCGNKKKRRYFMEEEEEDCKKQKSQQSQQREGMDREQLKKMDIEIKELMTIAEQNNEL